MLLSVFGLQNRLKSKRGYRICEICIFYLSYVGPSAEGKEETGSLTDIFCFSLQACLLHILLSVCEATPFPVCFLLKCCK